MLKSFPNTRLSTPSADIVFGNGGRHNMPGRRGGGGGGQTGGRRPVGCGGRRRDGGGRSGTVPQVRRDVGGFLRFLSGTVKVNGVWASQHSTLARRNGTSLLIWDASPLTSVAAIMCSSGDKGISWVDKGSICCCCFLCGVLSILMKKRATVVNINFLFLG